jgi:hypothetical protein
MRKHATLLAVLMLTMPLTATSAETQSDRAIRARAIEKCKANRGVDCTTESGLREWIEAERKRPSGQRSPLMQKKLEAERRAPQQPPK